MGVRAGQLVDPPVSARLGARRAEVFAHLREAGEPASVAEVAEATGLHVNTARFHLDALVDDGLAERTVEHRDTPGRRRVLYIARAEAGGPRSYGLLAEMLTGLVGTLEGAGARATDAGRAWGRHLVERPVPSEQLGEQESTTRLERLLAEVGFQPELRPEADGVRIDLRHCPFREVAERHTDIVCAMHLGLMQGALGELRAPWQADSLQPFVRPHLCVARLRPRQRPELDPSAEEPAK